MTDSVYLPSLAYATKTAWGDYKSLSSEEKKALIRRTSQEGSKSAWQQFLREWEVQSMEEELLFRERRLKREALERAEMEKLMKRGKVD